MGFEDRQHIVAEIGKLLGIIDEGKSHAAEPGALYLADEGYEADEFKRTASRLAEMGSTEYLALPHGRAPATTGSAAGIVET